MVYSSIAILAFLVHIIINFDVLKFIGKNSNFSLRSYRLFLYGVTINYIADAVWGLLYDAKLIVAVYIDTVIFFLAMMISVFLWTRYVIELLKKSNIFIKVLSWFGWIYLVFDVLSIIVNLFVPVKFYFDADGIYHACITRYIALGIQVFMFFITAVYVFIFALRKSGKDRNRHKAIGAFGIVMTVLVLLQTFYPLLPLYSIGYLLGTCFIHTFVLEDEKEEYRRELEAHISKEELQEIELGSAKKLAYTDALTGVKNKRAYTEAQKEIESWIESGLLTEFGIIVFDLNKLKIVNDTKGHEAGDIYIKEACHIICDIFKHSPVYRIGGDEFVVFLRGEDYRNRAKLLLAFETMMEKNIVEDKVVISCGFDDFNSSENDTFDSVFERADKKMYARKKVLKEMQAKLESK